MIKNCKKVFLRLEHLVEENFVANLIYKKRINQFDKGLIRKNFLNFDYNSKS